MTEQLEVYLHDERIGTVTPGPRRMPSRVRLVLADDYEPGSVRLTESFSTLPGVSPDDRLASNFIGGYTPEGQQRIAMSEGRGFTSEDLYGFLRAFGGSIAGALTFRVPGLDVTQVPHYEPLSNSDVGRLLRNAVDRHDLGVRDDSRSMIPGFQPKLLLANLGDGWMQPHGRAHSTHILKPRLRSRPERIYDEFYSHELSRAMGLSSFASEIQHVGQTSFLAIARFDRGVRDGTVQTIHQEDAAQALGIEWTDDQAKFQDRSNPRRRDRPSARAIGELFAGLSDDALETWIRQLTFRILIGDNDGHAKNVGILHLESEDTVTDLYDAVPNLFQDERIDWSMALAIDGQWDHRRVSVERIMREIDSWGGGLSRTRIEACIGGTLDSFAAALESVTAPSGISEGLIDSLGWNLHRLRSGHEISERRSPR
jgi:serine/threonine-protein kinase HipA